MCNSVYAPVSVSITNIRSITFSLFIIRRQFRYQLIYNSRYMQFILMQPRYVPVANLFSSFAVIIATLAITNSRLVVW